METSVATASFLEYCSYRNLSPRTLEFYRWGLRYLEAECQELPDDRPQFMQVLSQHGLGMESRRYLERVLRRFFLWVAVEYGSLNPMLSLERLPRRKVMRRVLSQVEIDRVWAACDDNRDRGLVAVVIDTGIRLGEIAGMSKADLGFDHLRVTGKIGDRQVPMTPAVRDMLLDLGNDDYVWVGRRGRRMSSRGIQRTFQRILKRAGLTGAKLGPHLLRHTFATEYCRRGGNVRVLQEIMGHEDLKTTMVYGNLAGRHIAEDHAIHSPINALFQSVPESRYRAVSPKEDEST